MGVASGSHEKLPVCHYLVACRGQTRWKPGGSCVVRTAWSFVILFFWVRHKFTGDAPLYSAKWQKFATWLSLSIFYVLNSFSHYLNQGVLPPWNALLPKLLPQDSLIFKQPAFRQLQTPAALSPLPPRYIAMRPPPQQAEDM